MSRLQTLGPLGSAAHSVATGGGRMMVAPIFEAETGNRVDVKLVEGEEGMEALRRKLFSSTGVPPENQILLFGGPPYKPLRTTLPPSLLVPSHDEAASSPPGTASRSVGKRKNRVYLFDWRTLAPERSMPSASPGAGALGSSTLVSGGNPAASFSSSTTAAAAVALQEAAEVSEFVGPVEVELPVEAGAAPSPPSARDSGLLKTIANCGRYSLSALNRGEAYLEVSCRRLRGGEVCAERMGTQMDALEAAVSNSLDHWESLQRGYSALKEKLEEQASRHEGMLETFERDLSALGNITLHPSLAMNPKDDAVAAGERSPLSRGQTDAGSEAARIPDGGGGGQGSRIPDGGSGGGGQGSRDNLSQQTTVKRVTLLDCVPVEREYKLLESCRTSQRRFGQEGKAVAQKYAAIKRSIEEQRADPVSKNDHVHGLLQRARDLCGEQKNLTAELRKNYSESFQLASKENWADDKEKQDAIRRMTELMATQENIVPTMRDNDQLVRATVVQIARAKGALSQTLRRRLREVSKLQTDVGKIQKHQELVRMAWGQKEEQFDHLGKVASMPAAYQAFLQEVARRRRYHQEAEAKVGEFCRSMSALRLAEITARENFRLAHLGNLPPVFVQMAPGLRNMPPVFTPPQVTPLEPGELPEVSPEDVTDTSQQPNLAAGTEVAPEAPTTSDGGDSVWLHPAKVTTQAAATAEAEEEPPAKISTSAEEGGDGGNVVGHDEPAPAEEVMVEKEVASKEEIQAAAAVEAREGSHPTQDREEASPNPLEAENARLVVELAEARARLEELETRAGASVEAQLTTAAATAAPVEKDSEASRSVSGERGDEAVSLPENKTCTNVSSGRGDEAASFPENITLTNISSEREDEAAASPGDKTSSSGGREDGAVEVETGTEASPTRQRAATDVAEAGDVATVLRERGRSGVSGRIADASGAETRRRSVSDVVVDAGRDSSKPASERRGSGPSREATQKQLVAYRTGLSMLVKLCNQLAAASVITAGGVDGGAPRADAGTTNPMALNAPSEAGAVPLAESSRHAEQSAEPLMAAQEPGAGMDVDAGGVLAGVEPATEKEAVEGGGGDHGEGARKWSTEATEKAESSREVASVSTATGSETPGGVEEASNAVGVGENDDNSAGLASVAEGRGGAGKPESAVGETEAEGPGTTATAASQPAEDTVASPLKPNREPSPAERGPIDAAAADTGTEARETAVTRSASRGVDKIKRASERVAVHIRRSHSRIEELLALEAMVSVPRISMCSFGVQDIALFLPTMVGLPKGSRSGRTVFLAFHVNCPNRYLSEESVNTAGQDRGSAPAFILGRIIMIEQLVATEEPNPYNVASNTVYYVLTAENLC